MTQTYDLILRQYTLRIEAGILRSNLWDFELVLRQATSRKIDSGMENLGRDWVSWDMSVGPPRPLQGCPPLLGNTPG